MFCYPADSQATTITNALLTRKEGFNRKFETIIPFHTHDLMPPFILFVCILGLNTPYLKLQNWYLPSNRLLIEWVHTPCSEVAGYLLQALYLSTWSSWVCKLIQRAFGHQFPSNWQENVNMRKTVYKYITYEFKFTKQVNSDTLWLHEVRVTFVHCETRVPLLRIQGGISYQIDNESTRETKKEPTGKI